MATIETQYEQLYPKTQMTIPHVATYYNEDALGGSASASKKSIGIIGSANSGKPNTVYEISDMIQAKNVFGSGELVDALELAWNPTAGGGTIYAMRVEDAQQSQLIAGGLKFVSNIYGDDANKVSIAFEQDSLTGAYKVTVRYAPDNYVGTYSGLGQMFKIGYDANDPDNATATYSVIKNSDGTAQKFVVDIVDSKTVVRSSTTTSTTSTTTLAPTTTSTTLNTNIDATSVRFDTNAMTGKVGDEIQLSWALAPTNATPASVKFVSDNIGVASVDNNGLVSLNANGNANITINVTNQNGESVTDVMALSVESASTTTTTSTSTTSTTTQKTNFALDPSKEIVVHQEFDLTSTDYNTVFKLMNGLSLLPNVVVDMDGLNDNSMISSASLDSATNVDFKSDASDNQVYVWAVEADVADKLQYDNYVSVVADLSKPIPQPFGSTYMVGGKTNPAPISWADKLTAFMQEPIYYLVVLSDLGAVHIEARTFVDEAYIQGHSIRAFVGGGFNESVGKLISRQMSLKDPRVALVGTSGYMSMQDGRNAHLPAYMVAAYTAGVASGLQIGGALTNKEADLNSIDQQFTSAQYNQLNSNGVVVIKPVINDGSSSGFRYVQDVTTDNSTNEPVKSRVSLGEITDFLFDDLRKELFDQFIGSNIRTTSSDLLKSFIDSYLYKQKLSANGLIVDYDPDSIQVTINGDTAWIMFTVAPSQTLDFIYVYGAYSNYVSSSSNTNGSFTVNANGDVVTTTTSDDDNYADSSSSSK